MSIIENTYKSSAVIVTAETNLNSMSSDEPNALAKCYTYRLKIAIPTLVAGIPSQLNVRSYDPLGKNAQKIKQAYKDPESIDNTRGLFVHRNLGVTISVSSIEDLGGGRYKLTFSDPEVDGILNGQTTYNALLEAVQELKDENLPLPKEHVMFKILVGLHPDSLPEIIEGVSFADRVEDMSIAHARGHFDWIKDALNTPSSVQGQGSSNFSSDFESKTLSTKIGWEEHSDKAPTANYLIKYLTAMNIKLYGPWDWNSQPNKKTAMPLKSHNQTNNIINSLYLAKDKNQNYVNLQSFEDMKKVLKDIIVIHDHIIQHSHIWSPDSKTGSTKEKAKTVFEKKNKEATQNNLIFKAPSFSEDNPVLVEGYCFMVLSALRIYLTVDENNLIVWKEGVTRASICEELNNGLGEKLISCIREQIVPIQEKNKDGGLTDKYKIRANTVTSDQSNWNAIYINAYAYMLEQIIKNKTN